MQYHWSSFAPYFEDKYSNSLSLLQSELIPSLTQKYGVQHRLFLLFFISLLTAPFLSTISVQLVVAAMVAAKEPEKQRLRRHFPSKRRAEFAVFTFLVPSQPISMGSQAYY